LVPAGHSIRVLRGRKPADGSVNQMVSLLSMSDRVAAPTSSALTASSKTVPSWQRLRDPWPRLKKTARSAICTLRADHDAVELLLASLDELCSNAA